MKPKRRLALQAAAGAALYPLAGPALHALDLTTMPVVEGLDDFWIATDAYVYGYPLVTMEMTRRVMTNVAQAEGTRAPMGHIIKLRQYPDASFKDVTAPNADTLYTTSFFDVGDERPPASVGRPERVERVAGVMDHVERRVLDPRGHVVGASRRAASRDGDESVAAIVDEEPVALVEAVAVHR